MLQLSFHFLCIQEHAEYLHLTLSAKWKADKKLKLRVKHKNSFKMAASKLPPLVILFYYYFITIFYCIIPYPLYYVFTIFCIKTIWL